MLKTKIIASKVQNLTDARYFAAWGVEYMSFLIEDFTGQAPAIKEMKDWVEGPIFALEYDEAVDIERLNVQLDALQMDHAIVQGNDASIMASDWEIIPSYSIDEIENVKGSCILRLAEYKHWTEELKSQLKHHCQEAKVYIDASFDAADVDDILSLGIAGLVLRGGDEEKVGVKTYDDLDEIMEALEID